MNEEFNLGLKARRLETKGILLYFENDEKAIEVGEYIDNLQSKIDKANEVLNQYMPNYASCVKALDEIEFILKDDENEAKNS